MDDLKEFEKNLEYINERILKQILKSAENPLLWISSEKI